MLSFASLAIMAVAPFQFLPATTSTAAPAPVVAAAGAEAARGITSFSVFVKGTSETTQDDKFKFTGFGSVTIDEGSGQLTYNLLLSTKLAVNGSGVVAVSEKNNIYGLIDTQSGTTVTGGFSGSGILDGKVDRNRTRFKGTLVVAVPNRLGPAPGGFVLTTMKIGGIVNNLSGN